MSKVESDAALDEGIEKLPVFCNGEIHIYLESIGQNIGENCDYLCVDVTGLFVIVLSAFLPLGFLGISCKSLGLFDCLLWVGNIKEQMVLVLQHLRSEF